MEGICTCLLYTSKTYAKKGQEVVDKNIAAVDATLENLHQVDTTGKTITGHAIPPVMLSLIHI